MKKLIALIAILALVTTVFATESDPSETVGFVKYSCVTTETTNNNFIALPLDAGYTSAVELGEAIGDCDAVASWDPDGQGWGDQASYLGPPINAWTGDFPIESGHAYMINVTSDVDVYIAGDLPADPVFDLVTTETTNNNAIMLPLSMSDLLMAVDLGNDIGDCDAVASWDPDGQGWGDQASYLGPPINAWTGDFAIYIGQAYMVNVTSDVIWPSSDDMTNSKKIKVQNSVSQSKEVRFISDRR